MMGTFKGERDQSCRDMSRVGANRGDGYGAGRGGSDWDEQGPEEGAEVDRMSNAGRRVDQYKGGDSTRHGPGFPARPWGRD